MPIWRHRAFCYCPCCLEKTMCPPTEEEIFVLNTNCLLTRRCSKVQTCWWRGILKLRLARSLQHFVSGRRFIRSSRWDRIVYKHADNVKLWYVCKQKWNRRSVSRMLLDLLRSDTDMICLTSCRLNIGNWSRLLAGSFANASGSRRIVLTARGQSWPYLPTWVTFFNEPDLVISPTSH